MHSGSGFVVVVETVDFVVVERIAVEEQTVVEELVSAKPLQIAGGAEPKSAEEM